jgi:hypothetical protein
MEEIFGDIQWFPHQCYDCKHWWMGGADVVCPKCGSTDVGVGKAVPEWTLSIEEEEDL